MVMPRSRSISMESSTCSLPAISRSVSPPVIWIRRSAKVDLPWSIWATMEKLRMFGMGAVVMGRGIALGSPCGNHSLHLPATLSKSSLLAPIDLNGRICYVWCFRSWKPAMHWRILSAFLFAAFFTFPAMAEKRVALVIGNSAYQSVPRLENPKNDALLVADTLQRLGFALVGGGAQVDLDKASFDQAVERFGNQLIGADVALFYYAGHGVQVRGTNYLVPITANPTRETDVDFQMVDVALVLRQMEGAGTKLNVVILDACRNNPFGGRGLRGADGGLAQIRAPEG